jgi:hypothetical protein
MKVFISKNTIHSSKYNSAFGFFFAFMTVYRRSFLIHEKKTRLSGIHNYLLHIRKKIFCAFMKISFIRR